jgi:Flagellar hook-length control protein FliK
MNEQFLKTDFSASWLPEPARSPAKNDVLESDDDKFAFGRLVKQMEQKLSGRRSHAVKSVGVVLMSEMDVSVNHKSAARPNVGLVTCAGITLKKHDEDANTAGSAPQQLDVDVSSVLPTIPFVQMAQSDEFPLDKYDPEKLLRCGANDFAKENLEKFTADENLEENLLNILSLDIEISPAIIAHSEPTVQPKGIARFRTPSIEINSLNEKIILDASVGKIDLPIEIGRVVTRSQFSFGLSASSILSEKIVKNLLGNPSEVTSSYVTPSFSSRPQVVKMLQIQLHPESLGILKLSMMLRGKELELKIEATSREAAETLVRDRKVLMEFIERAGFELGEKSVSILFKPEQSNMGVPGLGSQMATEKGAGDTQFSAMNFAELNDAGKDRRGDNRHAANTANDTKSGEKKSNRIEVGAPSIGIFI